MPRSGGALQDRSKDLPCIPKRPSGHPEPLMVADATVSEPAPHSGELAQVTVVTPPGHDRTGGEADWQRACPSAQPS